MDDKIRECYKDITFYVIVGALLCAAAIGAGHFCAALGATFPVQKQSRWVQDMLIPKLSGFGMLTWYLFRALLITKRLFRLKTMRRRLLLVDLGKILGAVKCPVPAGSRESLPISRK